MAWFGIHDVEISGSSIRIGRGRYQATEISVEPDASSASYPLAIAAVCGGEVTVPGLGTGALQGDARFAEVLEAVAGTGVTRVRFATSHPKDLSADTIRVLAEVDEVCPYLHLPVQSGSNRVLEAMNRRYTREGYLDLVDELYATVPGLALSTDVIVGFPGETDADFEDTLDLVSRARLDQAFTFIYSPREGTPAAQLESRVPREVSQERFDRLVEIVHASAQSKNDALVGETVDVLFEGSSKRDPDVLTGRTATNKVVHVPVPGLGAALGAVDTPERVPDTADTSSAAADGGAQRFAGTILPVRIEEAHTWFLNGSFAS
jgi:tRNA-2-methylthio-N6-dimethylallyladenosine synthase